MRAVAHPAAAQVERGAVAHDDGAAGARAFRRVDLTVFERPVAADDVDRLARVTVRG